MGLITEAPPKAGCENCQKILLRGSFLVWYDKAMIDSSELLFSVDENNNPIDPQPRLACHEAAS